MAMAAEGAGRDTVAAIILGYAESRGGEGQG